MFSWVTFPACASCWPAVEVFAVSVRISVTFAPFGSIAFVGSIKKRSAAANMNIAAASLCSRTTSVLAKFHLSF